MRTILLASVAAIGLAFTGPAMAQSASNITPSDTHSDIAPRLPAPPVAPDAGPRQYLRAAQTALHNNKTGEAQEALERAEARLLDRRTTNAGVDQGPMVKQVSDARDALGHGDVSRASQIVDNVLATPPRQASAAPATLDSMTAMPPAAAADAAAGNPSAIAGMPASGVTVYDHGEIPLPSNDDSMTFGGRSGDNAYTVHPRTGDSRNDEGPGIDTGN